MGQEKKKSFLISHFDHKSEARAWTKGFINGGASQVIKQGGNAERQSDQRQEPGLTHGEF